MLEYFVKPVMQKYVPVEHDRKEYARICAERMKMFREHIAQMEVPPELAAWASAMEQKYGSKAKVWCHDCDYITALMIVRYGEDVSHWPEEFSNNDIDRALTWYQGKNVPHAVVWRAEMEAT